MKAKVDRLVQRLAGSRTTFYLAAFVFLLFSAAGVMAVTGCEGCDDSSGTTQLPAPNPKLTAHVFVTLNGAYRTVINARAAGPPYPNSVTVIWTPPPGAEYFAHYGSLRPEQRDGPPLQFVWQNVPVNPSTGYMERLYSTYGPRSNLESGGLVNTVTVISGGEQTTCSVVGQGSADSPESGGFQAQGGWDEPDGLSAASQDDYYTWWIGQSTRVQGVALTTELCQQWADFTQQGTTFVALRFPVYPPTSVYTEPYTLPVVFRGAYSPTLTLQVGYTPVLTVPLEYKPGYFTFLENELPAAPGEHWLALGATTMPTVTCPPDLTCPGGQWRLEAGLYLDFGGAFNTFADRVLPYYYCYEGHEPPLPLTALQGTLGAEVTSYQGWGITCLGPHYLTLSYGLGDWSLSGQGGRWITATQTISFAHRIHNTTFPLPRRPLTFTLVTSSTLDAGWAFYADPQGQTPLADPIRVDGTTLDFWVFGQAPVGATDGAYALFVTARTDDAPPASRQATDLLWVGDWVTPPGPPPWYRLYLPLILRQ
jgi:hypothetical protein